MTNDPLDAMKARWNHIQGTLFPWLREEVDPMTEALGRLVTTLDVIGLEAFVAEPPRGPGRPPADRRALARAFVAKAVLGVPTTNALIERLDVDKSLRRILGWERRAQVPSEATFSRAFAEFAQGDLPDKMHAALIERSLGGRIVGVIARDATEIEARERPAKKETNDKEDDPPPPHGARPTRKRGRPRKDEQRPKPEPTRLERQTTQNVDQMLADLPTACDVGSKKNSKGYKETWIGYKLHLDVACGQIPVSSVRHWPDWPQDHGRHVWRLVGAWRRGVQRQRSNKGGPFGRLHGEVYREERRRGGISGRVLVATRLLHRLGRPGLPDG